MSCPSVSTIREDDLLLDQLGGRGDAGPTQLGRLLAAWTHSLDRDVVDSDLSPGDVLDSNFTAGAGLGGAVGRAPMTTIPAPSDSAGASLPPVASLLQTAAAGSGKPGVLPAGLDAVRRLRLGGSRVVAVVASAALVSGVGVAAALTGHDVPGVSQLLRSAAASGTAGSPAGTQGAEADRVQLTAVLARCRELFVSGNTVAARSLLSDMLRRDDLPADLRYDAERLQAQAVVAAPAMTTVSLRPPANPASTLPRSVWTPASVAPPAAPSPQTLVPDSPRRPSRVTNRRPVASVDSRAVEDRVPPAPSTPSGQPEVPITSAPPTAQTPPQTTTSPDSPRSVDGLAPLPDPSPDSAPPPSEGPPSSTTAPVQDPPSPAPVSVSVTVSRVTAVTPVTRQPRTRDLEDPDRQDQDRRDRD